MAIVRTYQCPGADGQPHQFDFLHHPSDEPAPPSSAPSESGEMTAETEPATMTVT